MQILVATRPIAARVGYKACYKIEFVLLLESVHNACKFEMLIILVNHSKVCIRKNVTLHPLPLAVTELLPEKTKFQILIQICCEMIILS